MQFYEAMPWQKVDHVTELERLVSLFADFNEAVLLADPDRRMRWVNDAAIRQFGYERDALLGQKTEILYADPTDFHRQGAVRYNRASVPKSATYRVEYRRRNGSSFLSETSGGLITGADGQPLGYLAIIRDISATSAAEEMLRKLYLISSSQEMSSVQKISQILRLGQRYFGLGTAMVGLISGESYTVLHARSAEMVVAPGARFGVTSEFWARALHQDLPVSLPLGAWAEAPTPAAAPEAVGAHPCYGGKVAEAVIAMPLTVAGERFGILSFSALKSEGKAAFGPKDGELMKLLAAWLAQELGQAKALHRLEQEAQTDFLTGCVTRRRFHAEVQALVMSGPPAGENALVLLDIDHFKRINDTHGHDVGDAILRQIGQICRDHCRETDTVGRFGGEEFAILLRRCSAGSACRFSERLRLAIEAHRFDLAGTDLRVTASFGVTEFMGPGDHIDALVKRADVSLYAAKAGGRNRCCKADDVPNAASAPGPA